MFLSMLERKPTIGENAHSHCSYFPKYVVYDVLKIIGKSINEIAIDPKWGFQLVNQNGIVYFQIETSNGPSLLSQEIIIAAFFKLMKSQAETHLNTSVKEINLVTDCRLNESQKMVFCNAAAKLNFEIVSYRYSL
jgi:molecular chaperone DnaK (HSP70)